MKHTGDPALDTLQQALADAERRRTAAANAIVRCVAGGCYWNHDRVRRGRDDLARALLDIAVAKAAIRELASLDAEASR